MSRRNQWTFASTGSISTGIVAIALAQTGGCKTEMTVGGGCPQSYSDNNDCTEDVCENGIEIHTSFADDTPCAAGQHLGQCRNGRCRITCKSPKDCPTSTACITWSCSDDQLCESQPSRSAGDPIPEKQQKPGDCKKIVCTSSGSTEPVEDDGDAPESTDCTKWTCQRGTPKKKAAVIGTSCNNGQGKFCDGNNNCVECVNDLGCADTETCGEDKQCKTRNGNSCTTSQECNSGICVDRVCCDKDCGGDCETCSAEGYIGSCQPVKAGETNNNCNPDSSACNGSGICIPGGNNGDQCMIPEDCVTRYCYQDSTCRPCTSGSHCSSGMCDNGLCK